MFYFGQLEERLPMTASAIHDHDFTIIKSAESLKLFWYEEEAWRLETKIG